MRAQERAVNYLPLTAHGICLLTLRSRLQIQGWLRQEFKHEILNLFRAWCSRSWLYQRLDTPKTSL
jgi:hypothetical protein